MSNEEKAKLSEAIKQIIAMQTAAQVATQAKTGGAHVAVSGAEEGPEAEE
ncbi:MAG: hypothetical protein KJ720_17085 [Proteobacteria bacterium]|nr:hypothetical protein [Pseudomonadota bacterium]MBU2470421.1 hypothetical protein [Pseudomonadota bacterium]MBU2516426.1 hypothetical protein [Pseudomonadota bacterium]